MLLPRVTGRTVDSIRRFAEKYREDRLRRLLRDKTEYVFTTDYVSSMVPLWRKYTGEFTGKENVTLLEIGSFEGRSCLWFLENVLTHPTASITCVDIFFRKRELVFDHNIRISGLGDKVTKIKGTSESILPKLRENSFDIIYVDGSHEAANVLMDAVASWLLLKSGGIMIFDDYEWEPERLPENRPKVAVDLFLKVFYDHVRVLHKGYQVIISKSLKAGEPENFHGDG